MILKFKIKNYRSYKDEVVFSMEPNSSDQKPDNILDIKSQNDQDFRVLKTAMIYGANASGKTNIIRALSAIIYLILNKPKVDQRLTIYDPFILDSNSKSEPCEFELTFLGPDSIKYLYKFSVLENVILTEELNYFPNGKTTLLFERSPFEKDSIVQNGRLGGAFKKKEITIFSNQLILSKFGDDEPHELLSGLILFLKSYNIINATNKKHLDSIQRTVSKTLFENDALREKVAKLIHAADTRIEAIKISHLSGKDNGKDDENDNKSLVGVNPYDIKGLHSVYENDQVISNHLMEFKNWSVGTQALYILGGEVVNTLDCGGVLIIDELDNSLHPFLTKMIVMLFQSKSINNKNAQLIFTTHDITLLDRDLVRRDQVWIAEKDDKGCTEMYSLQDFEGVREDTPFDKWYLAGKFGGLPRIKSIDNLFD